MALSETRWRRWLLWKPATSKEAFVVAAGYLVSAVVVPVLWVIFGPGDDVVAIVWAVPFLGHGAWNVAKGVDMRRIGH